MEEIRLGDICEIKSSKRIYQSEYSEKGVPFYRGKEISELSRGENPQVELYITRERYEELKEKFGAPKKGDLLITSVGTIGNTWVSDGREFYYKDGNITQIIDNENINTKYISYLFKADILKRQYLGESTGTAQVALTIAKLNNLLVPISSIDIQNKIVEILDKAQELIDKRKEQIESLDELVKSKFIEMFGDPISNPKGWNREKMNDVAPVVNYKGDFNEEKIWLLNLDMVESNTGKIIDYNYVMKNEIGSSTYTFDTTNVLYSKLRPYLNKVVIPNSIGYATSEMVPLQPLNSKINRYYLTYMLRNKSFVDYISEKVAGAKMPRVSMNDFRNFEVPIPPIELQNQFVDFVKQVDKLKVRMEKSLKELDDNFNSLMKRAFNNELFK